jgi:hypothetical protein
MAREMIAMLCVSREDQGRCLDFFVREMGIDAARVARNMHLTLYTAKFDSTHKLRSFEKAAISVHTAETRFMVMAPGGENPRADIDPRKHKIGMRIQKTSQAFEEINRLRERMLGLATGAGLTSLSRNNSRVHYQPHITLLFPDHGFSSLSELAAKFRASIPTISFDRFAIR